MIISVCADKGSPGVPWTATALSMLWPGERVLLEADVSGGDAAFRLRTPTGGLLGRQPSLRSLSVDVRSEKPSSLVPYAQPTSLGFPVIPAVDMQSHDFASLARHWPAIGAATATWSGTAVADLGRLQEDTASGPLAAASDLVLLVGRPTPESMHHLRERAKVLKARLEQGAADRSPLHVALICAPSERKARLADLKALFAADPATNGVPIVGMIADDAGAIAALTQGVVSKKLMRSQLMLSVQTLVDALQSSKALSVRRDGSTAEDDERSQWAPDQAVRLHVGPAGGLAGRPITNPGGWS